MCLKCLVSVIFHVLVQTPVTNMLNTHFCPFFSPLQETTVDDAHIRSINTLAMKLERQNKEETKTIYERRKQLNEKYVFRAFCIKKIKKGRLDDLA